MDSTTRAFRSSGKAIYREVPVVGKSKWGKWIGTSTVYYTVGRTAMSKGDSQYAPVSVSGSSSAC